MRNNQTKQVSQGIIALALGGFLGPMGGVASADDLGETSVGSDRAAGAHIMNLRDVEMSVLIDDVSAITGYTFIVHPSVRGRVTVSSQAPLSTAEVFQVFLSTLRVHGFTAIPTQGGAYKVVPEQTASAAAGFVASGAGGDQFETTVISLRNFDAVEAAKMIKPLTNPQGQITASPRSNSVIIVDYAANIDRVRQVVGQLDQDRSSVVTVALNNMPAAEMAKIVNGLDVGQSGAFDYDVGALSVDSNNSIVLRGEASDVDRVAEIVRQLDTDNRSNADTLKVIALKNAEAAELAPILESLGATMAAAAAPDGGVKAQPTIAVHEPTNALVISADSRILRQLEDVVSDLDVRRAQVLVEAVIVELSDNTARELGVQFAIGGGDSDLPLVSSNFANSPVSLLTLAGAVTQDGFDDGATGPGAELASLAASQLASANGALAVAAGVNNNGRFFGAIINAVEDDTASNLLSTPSVLTLDNETASILVGQEIPITTGEALSSNNNNPFRTVEREDVGVQLEVTPQIGDGDSIKLDIRQEVSSVFGPITSTSTDLITNKREVSTTVLADDGELIVLGGLIQEEESISDSKIPLLGDIPILGRAFRSEGRAVQRTNLMVFLRPTVVRDVETARRATGRKLDYARSGEFSKSPEGQSNLDSFMRDVLGVDD